MAKLSAIISKLDDFFSVKKLDADPSMSRFIPMVYDPIGFDWKQEFEPDFALRFNGLMIKGLEDVDHIWTIVFPSEEVLETILNKAEPGDLIFSHHPINMECGDPQDRLNPNKARGFLPINPETIKKIKDKKISIYTCHALLDTNRQISTNNALVNLVGGKILDEFLPYGIGFAGLVCEIAPIAAKDLAEKLRETVGLPYVETSGKMDNTVKRLAIIAGGAGSADDMRMAEEKNVDCLVTGEVSAKIHNDYAKHEQEGIDAYLPNTKLSLIGLSHAGSEFVTIRDQVTPWLKDQFGIPVEAVTEKSWWR